MSSSSSSSSIPSRVTSSCTYASALMGHHPGYLASASSSSTTTATVSQQQQQQQQDEVSNVVHMQQQHNLNMFHHMKTVVPNAQTLDSLVSLFYTMPHFNVAKIVLHNALVNDLGHIEYYPVLVNEFLKLGGLQNTFQEFDRYQVIGKAQWCLALRELHLSFQYAYATVKIQLGNCTKGWMEYYWEVIKKGLMFHTRGLSEVECWREYAQVRCIEYHLFYPNIAHHECLCSIWPFPSTVPFPHIQQEDLNTTTVTEEDEQEETRSTTTETAESEKDEDDDDDEVEADSEEECTVNEVETIVNIKQPEIIIPVKENVLSDDTLQQIQSEEIPVLEPVMNEAQIIKEEEEQLEEECPASPVSTTMVCSSLSVCSTTTASCVSENDNTSLCLDLNSASQSMNSNNNNNINTPSSNNNNNTTLLKSPIPTVPSAAAAVANDGFVFPKMTVPKLCMDNLKYRKMTCCRSRREQHMSYAELYQRLEQMGITAKQLEAGYGVARLREKGRSTTEFEVVCGSVPCDHRLHVRSDNSGAFMELLNSDRNAPNPRDAMSREVLGATHYFMQIGFPNTSLSGFVITRKFDLMDASRVEYFRICTKDNHTGKNYPWANILIYATSPVYIKAAVLMLDYLAENARSPPPPHVNLSTDFKSNAIRIAAECGIV